MPCPFCRIISGAKPRPKRLERRGPRGDGVVLFEPLNPVAPGHTLIVPTRHVADAAESPNISATVAYYAAEYAAEQGVPFNLITSGGTEATQSVFHLHWHWVPRADGDGLQLPWTGQHRAEQLEQRLAAVREELDAWQATITEGVMAGTDWERCLRSNLPRLREAIGDTQ